MDLQPVQVSESVNNTPPFLDVSEEMSKPYVQSCREVFPEEDVKTGIRYLNTLGGISRHRNHTNLSNAILHVHRMRDTRRINSLGLPDDFPREILVDVLVRTGNNELDDVIHAIKQCLSEGFFPEPEECAEKIHAMKGIEELRAEVEERKIELIHSSEVHARGQSAMFRELVESKMMLRDLQAKHTQEKGVTQHWKKYAKEMENELKHYQDQQPKQK